MIFLMKTNNKNFMNISGEESEDISDALTKFDGEYDEEELRIFRVKF